MNIDLEGIRIPDSKLAREIMELVRDTEPPLLFHHSSRVYYWGALAGKRRGLRFDAELLYAGAMFHDMGLTISTAPPMSAPPGHSISPVSGINRSSQVFRRLWFGRRGSERNLMDL